MDNYVDKLWNETDTVAALDALVDADTAVTVIKRDMFNSLASIATQMFSEGNGVLQIKRLFSNFERRYKKEKKVKHMPGSYRSAKSVILQALRVEVDILDPGGTPRGKTEIEKDISRAKKRSKETVRTRNTVIDALQDTDSLLNSLYPRPVSPLDDSQKREAKARLEYIKQHVEKISRTYGLDE